MAESDQITFIKLLQESNSLAGTSKGKGRKRRPTKRCQLEGCDGWAWAQGYCDSHYQKLKRLGIIKAKRILNNPLLRFYQQIEVDSVSLCWEWRGWVHPRGYGILPIGGRAKNVRVHRFAYELFFGAISDGMMVLHDCDNRRCANPAHLFLGDNLDNMQDCAAKGRSGGQLGKCSPKVTKRMAMAMRVLYARGEHSFRLLAVIYGIEEETARKILKGQSHLAA